MIYKLHKNGSYNIHTIKTDRFKNVRMEIFFRNNINVETLAKRTILFNYLMESSEEYQTKRDLTLKLEELYNAVSYSTNTKVGNEIISSICIDFLNPKYTEEDYLEDAIKLPFSLIFKPNMVDNEFNKDILESVKTRLISDINAIKETPSKLAIQNALKAMDENSVSSVSLLGKTSEVEVITSGNLVDEYKNILKHDYVDIFIIGDIDMNKAIDYINKYALFNTIKTHNINLIVDNNNRKKANVVREKSSFEQTQLVYILNTLNLTAEEKKYAFIIYNMILGGGSLETKLYQSLRDKNSLCYNVTSIYQKYDSLVLIHTAIDTGKVDLAIKLIKATIKEMEENVTDEEVSRAVNSVVTSINMALDQPDKIIDLYLFNYIADLDPVETRIMKFREITKEDVMRVAKKVAVNTIYTLEGGANDEEN